MTLFQVKVSKDEQNVLILTVQVLNTKPDDTSIQQWGSMEKTIAVLSKKVKHIELRILLRDAPILSYLAYIPGLLQQFGNGSTGDSSLRKTTFHVSGSYKFLIDQFDVPDAVFFEFTD